MADSDRIMNLPRVFYSGRFRYRKAGVLFAALLAVAFGTAPLVVCFRRFSEIVWSWKAIGAACFVGAICALLLFAGIKLFLKWLTGTSLALEVTTEGVRYGNARHAWPDIRWIGGTTNRGRVQLRLKVNGLARPDIQLLVDEPLTVDRYDALMQELGFALRETHPHVAVG